MLDALIITTLTGSIHHELVETLNIANQPRGDKDLTISYQLVSSLSSSTFFSSSDWEIASKLAIFRNHACKKKNAILHQNNVPPDLRHEITGIPL